MNKTIALLAASTVLVGAANAQDTGDVSVSATVGYESEYVFRGIQLAPGSLQASVEAAFAGAYVGLWTNQPIFTDGGNVDNEIDFYAGYSFAASDVVSIDFGATYYVYPETSGSTFEDTLEAFIGGSFDVLLAPSLYVYYDKDLETFTVEGSIGHSIDLGESLAGTTLDLGATFGWVEPDVAGDYLYYGATADLTYAFTDSASGSVGVRYSRNDLPNAGFFDKDNFWFGFSFTAGF